MNSIRKIGIAFILFFTSSQLWAKASEIPVKEFFKNPDYTALQLSPNGNFLHLERRKDVISF